jgi:subtilisin family serine protease
VSWVFGLLSEISMRHKIIFIPLLLLLASVPMAAGRFILDVSPSLAPAIAAQYGLVIVKQIPNHDIFLVTASDTVNPSQLMRQLSSDPNVLGVELDGLGANPESPSGINLDQSTAGILDGISNLTAVGYFGAQVPSYYVSQSATRLIRLAEAQSTFNATGVGIVAIIDTGVDPDHVALQASLLPGYDFTRGRSGANEFLDLDQSTAGILDQSTAGILDINDVVLLNQSTAAVLDQSTAGILDSSTLPVAFGHGTMVAGIVHLVAPTAQILPLKAFSSDGTAHVFDIISAVYYAVARGADVINMSFDIGQTDSHELNSAINYANSHGVVCVAAVGNSGLRIVVYPAGSDNVLGIASTTTSATPDQESLFTNYGPVAEMAAPGEAIMTTYPGNFYAAAWGTSFSAPFVSGTVALLQQVNPKLNYSSAADALQKAVKTNSNLGWGRLDVYRAVGTYAH